MIALRGLHLLLTYQCNFECDHCFVWGGPDQAGTMTVAQMRDIFAQGRELGSVDNVYFEGGEPFLYYATMLEGVREVTALGWAVGALSNAYWATSDEDARLSLRPLAEAGLCSLTVSDDAYHGSSGDGSPPRVAAQAAEELGISTGSISIRPAADSTPGSLGPKGEPITGGSVMFRGRAAVKLAEGMPRRPWQEFTSCPHEELVEPTRVHIDPLGYVHLCQGLTMGNLWSEPLAAILRSYVPAAHPICGPLIEGGPAALARAFDVPHNESYVDACHMCYEVRASLRCSAPEWLAPDQMYGDPAPSTVQT